MKINRKNVDICWLYLDAVHPEYNNILQKLKTVHQAKDRVLSVNIDKTNSYSLVKLLGTMPVLTSEELSAVLRVFTYLDHSEAISMVTNFNWREEESE
jgi:hypothetical protein